MGLAELSVVLTQVCSTPVCSRTLAELVQPPKESASGGENERQKHTGLVRGRLRTGTLGTSTQYGQSKR